MSRILRRFNEAGAGCPGEPPTIYVAKAPDDELQ